MHHRQGSDRCRTGNYRAPHTKGCCAVFAAEYGLPVESVEGMMNAAPIACTARAEIHVAVEVGNPANTLPATNIVRPVRKARLRPQVSAILPRRRAAPPVAPHRGC